MQTLPEGSGIQTFTPTHTLKPVERQVLGESPESPALWRYRACKISDGEYKTVIGVKPGLSKERIPEKAQQELREKSVRSWVIRRFTPVSDQVEYDPRWSASLKDPGTLKVITQELDESDLPEGQPLSAFVLKTPEGRTINRVQYITLPDPRVAGNGHQMVLSNGNRHKKYDQLDIGFRCSSRRAEIGDEVWLKSGDAVVLESCVGQGKKDQWRVLAKKEDIDITLETNPLLRNSGEVQIGDDETGVSHPYDGEYFIPLYKLNRLLEKKLHKHQGFDWASCDDFKDVNLYLERLKQKNLSGSHEYGVTGHVVIESPVSNHTVAARIHIEEGKVLCFVQDGLGADSADARKVRDGLAEQIRQVFPDLPLLVATPREAFQTDYYSCGVVAEKAMTFFAKQGDRVDALFRDIPTPRPGTVKVSSIPVSSLPAGLLKMCQKPKLLKGSQQLTEIVSQKKGTSLGCYFASYRTKMLDETRECGFRWIEGAAIAKRCQNFSELFSTGVAANRPESSEATSTVTKRKIKKIGQKRRMPAGNRLHRLTGTEQRGKYPPDIQSTEFLFRMASDPNEQSTIYWTSDDSYVCHVKNPAALAKQWNESTGGTSKFENFTRSLRHHTGEEMLKCPAKRKYRFNPENSDVKRWKDEVAAQQSQPVVVMETLQTQEPELASQTVTEPDQEVAAKPPTEDDNWLNEQLAIFADDSESGTSSQDDPDWQR